MGRLIILLLLIAAAYLVWRAFGPQTWKRNALSQGAQRAEIKGPDDDDNFLWELEKRQFKERRAKEEAQKQEEERIQRAQSRYHQAPAPKSDSDSDDATSDDSDAPDTPASGDNNSSKPPNSDNS